MVRAATTPYDVGARRPGSVPERRTGGALDRSRALLCPRLSLRPPPRNEGRAENGTIATELRRANLDVV
jgi:hypothetical protein